MLRPVPQGTVDFMTVLDNRATVRSSIVVSRVVANPESYKPGTLPREVVLTIGSWGGWLTAFGGAWKDAPVEGFETFKFFRSPLVALFWATVMAFFTTNWIFLAMTGLGYTIATIETYKTFFFPSKPRGKFAGKPILFPEMVTKRYWFVPVYVAIWVAVAAKVDAKRAEALEKARLASEKNAPKAIVMGPRQAASAKAKPTPPLRKPETFKAKGPAPAKKP